MLDLARREAERHGLGHIVFQTPAELFAAPRARSTSSSATRSCSGSRPMTRRRCWNDWIGLVGPGGVGVFQWPYRTADSSLVAASRWLREHVPGVNILANLVRRKPPADPFIPTHIYDLDEMLPAFDPREFRSTHVVLEHHEHLDYAIVLAHRGEAPARSTRAGPRGNVARDTGSVATAPAADAVSDAELEAYNRAAEAYFTSLSGWDHHLAKPFSQMEETPTLLMSVAVLLQALRLTPGMTVLEFGAGSGWLSRFLTQMGCRVVLLDVSPTALRIARELYARQPVLGSQPAPAFLEFDGRRIDLPDASVDRIVCFDAFHHAPNPRAVIREFGRILVDGGIAGFAEPGPRHAEAPRSQFESQTYGVVELDVDVHDIWRTAKSCGFRDLRMCVFHGPPHHVSLEEYEELVAGGPAQEAWLASTRKFLRHVRSFCLVKGGAGRADSRSPGGLACDIRAVLVNARPSPDSRSPSTRSSRTAAWRRGSHPTRRAAPSRSARISTTRRQARW